jgi:single-strand DNA-binding protein
MAFSLNKVILIGNLGNDAETRFTTSNLSITTYSVATTNSYKGKDGNWVNETTWHNIVSFGLSDYFKDALKKGKKFYIEGRLSKRDYTDKEGIKRYITEVVSEKIIPLDTRGEESDFSKEQSSVTETSSEGEVPIDEVDDLPF